MTRKSIAYDDDDDDEESMRMLLISLCVLCSLQVLGAALYGA